MAVGTSELLDAFAALGHVSWRRQADFRETLAATLAKSPEDRRVFELVFERFFFRATEAEASRHELGRRERAIPTPPASTWRSFAGKIAAALARRLGGRDARFGAARNRGASAGRAPGVIGVDVQRIRRALGLRTEPQPQLPADDPRRAGLTREQLRRFERICAASSSARRSRARRRCHRSAR